MRELLETCLIRDSQIGSGNTWQNTVITITANLTIPDNSPEVIAIDATATPRTITLPTLKDGVRLTIVNTSASAVLTINTAAGVFVQDIGPGAIAGFSCIAKGGTPQWFAGNGPGGTTRSSLPLTTGAAPSSYATVGAQTYTAADLLCGTIVRDTNGASRTDTLPTAALLVAAIPGAKVGDVVSTWIVNGADAAEVLTIQAGAGGGFDTNQTATSRVIGQNTSKMLKVRLTNVTLASEAYVAYF